MGNEELKSSCTGKACSWNIHRDSGSCSNGSGDCVVAELLEAETSGFHDEHLAEATRQIRAIMQGIPEDPEGRKLSFIITNMGVLLARLDHGAEVPEDAINGTYDDATIAKALKLRGFGQSAAM